MGIVSDTVKRLVIHQLIAQRIASADGKPNVVAKANDLGVSGKSLQRWLDAVSEQADLGQDPKVAKTDDMLLERLSNSPAVRTLGRDVQANKSLAKPPTTPEWAPPSHLCKIVVEPTTGQSIYGTGFRMTNRLVITCRHVLPADIGACDRIRFKFPVHHTSEHEDPSIRAVQVFQSTREADHVRLLLSSSPRDKKTEVANWKNLKARQDRSLDFALLEIDYDRAEDWEIRIFGSRSRVQTQVVSHIMLEMQKKLPQGAMPLQSPGTEDYAEDLEGREEVYLRLMRDDLEEKMLQAPIAETNKELQRVRYLQSKTSVGDSGAPVVERRGDDHYVIAIHNARIKKKGQAVPMGPILRSILNSSLDDAHKAEMASVGWFPSEYL